MAMRRVYNEIKGMKLKEVPSYFKPMLSVGYAKKAVQRASSSRAQAARRATWPSLIPSSLLMVRVLLCPSCVDRSPTVAAVASHPMSHTIGTTQVEEDISKNAEKIADSVRTAKSEESVKEDNEEAGNSGILCFPIFSLKAYVFHFRDFMGFCVLFSDFMEFGISHTLFGRGGFYLTQKFEEMEDPPHLQHWIYAPEKSTNTGREPLEPEQSKDEEAEMWYNVRFRPGINREQQSDLLIATLTNDRCYLPNIEDDCIMEVFTTKEDVARIKGLDEVVSVEPFLGVHKYTFLSPPAPEVGRYRVGVLWPDTMRYI
ncbi:hypothetical protein V6N13_136188 [Hibiscus sabdariffa]|uniref:Uncharacterized protein n=1 Tax=Hibiscus sabdariffa TaxID=183260 RepID=A0ABR2DPD4_9ROSI